MPSRRGGCQGMRAGIGGWGDASALWRSTPTAHSIPHTRSIWRSMAVIKPLARSSYVYYREENNLSGKYGQCHGQEGQPYHHAASLKGWVPGS